MDIAGEEAEGSGIGASVVCADATGDVEPCLRAVFETSPTGCCLQVAGAFAPTFFSVTLLTGYVIATSIFAPSVSRASLVPQAVCVSVEKKISHQDLKCAQCNNV